MTEQNRTAVVTGAHGAIGRHVSSALAAQGWTVLGIGHGHWDKDEQVRWGVEGWSEQDISLASLRSLPSRPILVAHCAGSGAVGASFAEPHLDFERTVATTAAVLEFIRADCPDAALVYPSSAAVYGVADHFPMTEDTPLRPASPYGAHKRSAEDLVREYARFFNLNAAVIRLFSIYGEGFRKQLLWDACNRIVADQTEFFGTGGETRDWLHVSDAADLVARASVHASPECPIVNGGSGIAVPVRDVLTELFGLLGRDDHPRFLGNQRAGDPHDYQADIEKARLWGWQPTISWRDGLRRYVAWYRQECGLT